MVRAILDGRKTQTRRVIRWKPYREGDTVNFNSPAMSLGHYCTGAPESGHVLYSRRKGGTWSQRTKPIHPRYQPGDILYVRETWARISDWTDVDPEVGIPDGYIYKADWMDGAEAPKWRPSIHMPKDAARLFPLVNADRVERLQDITEEDARAEGFSPDTPFKNMGYQWSTRENFAEY